MVLDILRDSIGASSCIHTRVSAKFHIRRKVRLGEPVEDLVEEDNNAEEPAYDPRVMELHQQDAEFGPGVSKIVHDSESDTMNKSFITAL